MNTICWLLIVLIINNIFCARNALQEYFYEKNHLIVRITLGGFINIFYDLNKYNLLAMNSFNLKNIFCARNALQEIFLRKESFKRSNANNTIGGFINVFF